MSLADEIGSRRCDLLFAAPGQPLAVIEIDGSQHRSQALIDMRRVRALASPACLSSGFCSFLPYRGDGLVGKIPLAMRIGRDYTITKADRPNAWKRTAEAVGLPPGETPRTRR